MASLPVHRSGSTRAAPSLDSQQQALAAAAIVIVAANAVPALFEQAEGFGSLGVAVAAFISLAWFVNYKNGSPLK